MKADGTSLGVGLLGLGRHGMRYARHLVAGDVPGAHLAGVWRRNAALGVPAAEELGTPFFADADALIASPSVDVVVIVVPVSEHRRLAEASARAGKPVLLEKPIAGKVADANAMIAAFEAANLPFMIAQTLRFDPLTLALRDALSEIGPVRAFTLEQRLENRGLTWEDDPAVSGGGVVIQTAIHTIDATHLITGGRLRVLDARFASVQNQRTEDSATLSLELVGGAAEGNGGGGVALGLLASSKVGPSRHMRYAFYGRDAALEGDFMARTLTVTRGTDRTVRTVANAPTIVPTLSAFRSVVADGGPNLVPGSVGRDALAVVEAAYGFRP